MPGRIMALRQIVALMMLNKWVKFEDSSFNSMEVMGKIQLFVVSKGAYFCQFAWKSYPPWSDCSPCDGKQVCEVWGW